MLTQNDYNTLKGLGALMPPTLLFFNNKIYKNMPRPKGSPNKLTSEIKERLSQVIMDAMSTIDIDSMTQNEKLKLIQIGLTYVVPRLKHTEETNEVPTNFQIEIIDKTSDVDK
jgi:hypothetical protein